MMLRTLLTLAAVVALAAPTTALAADAEAGNAAYQANCASCHGPTGAGDGPVAVALDPKPRNFSDADFKFDTDGDGKTGTDADIANIVKNGAAEYGGSVMMAPLPHLSADDVANITAYIRTLAE